MSVADPDVYRVFAIKYANSERDRETFFLPPLEPGGKIGFNNYVWLIAGEGRHVLVDTGFSEDSGSRRKRAQERCPVEALSLCGIDPDQIKDVVITHLHFDHAGNMNKLRNARFHIQRREIEFVTGPSMASTHPSLGGSIEVGDIRTFVDLNFAGRVAVLDGFAEVAPGIEVYHVGGHTPGQQILRVKTARGWIVLANDACHYELNLVERRPISYFVNLEEMFVGFETILRLADGDLSRIIPGHDPIVMQRFPALDLSLKGIVARVDLPPAE
jgi:glyoxylase-like metal-dependent hydrolase (beta-lactamase superfamily II)